MSTQRASRKRAAEDSGKDTREGKRPATEGSSANPWGPFDIAPDLSTIQPHEFLKASPDFDEWKYLGDIWQNFAETGTPTHIHAMRKTWFEVRKPTTQELWSTRVALTDCPPSRLGYKCRTLNTLELILASLSPDTQPLLYQKFLLMKLDYLMNVEMKSLKGDEYTRVHDEFPDLREQFDNLAQMLIEKENLEKAVMEEVNMPMQISGAAAQVTDFLTLKVNPEDVTDISRLEGMQKAKQAMRKAFVLVKKFPHLVEKNFGVRNMLIHGVAGTGKTTLALALAKEPNIAVFSVSSSSLVDRWVGASERNVRAMFETADKCRPSVIVLDEIDAICSVRERHPGDGTQRMASELLTCLSRYSRVTVIGTTNLPWYIDPAFARRFPTKILVTMPTKEERASMFRTFLSRYPSEVNEMDIAAVAEACKGFTGSTIEETVRSAADDTITSLDDAEYFKESVFNGETCYQPADTGIARKDIPDPKLIFPVSISKEILQNAIAEMTPEVGVLEAQEQEHLRWKAEHFVAGN